MCWYLCLVSQPRQPVWQQGTKSHPTLVQLLRRLGNVISTTPLWRGQTEIERGLSHTDTQTHIHGNNSHGHDWSRCRGTDINTHYPCTQNVGNVICRRVEASHQYSEQNMSSEKLFVCLPTEHTRLAVHLTRRWLTFKKNANSQFKVHVKTPVPRKWETSKRFQEGKINAKVVQRQIHTPVSERAHWTPLAGW